jgi:hypothetical protein
MLTNEPYTTLKSAYLGYFDDVSPASAVSLGAPGPKPQVAHSPGPMPQNEYKHRQSPFLLELSQRSISLTPLEFGILCACSGVALGLVIGQALGRKKNV